jgi:hypothetical protein
VELPEIELAEELARGHLQETNAHLLVIGVRGVCGADQLIDNLPAARDKWPDLLVLKTTRFEVHEPTAVARDIGTIQVAHQ